jgi:hypothetical protein
VVISVVITEPHSHHQSSVILIIMSCIKHLVFLLLMILVDASFAQQSSGDGMNSHVDQEDDTNETLICINPYNSSAANHRNDADAIETTEINYTDENDAIMHGQCLSACLGEMMANENVTFESSYNNKVSK